MASRLCDVCGSAFEPVKRQKRCSKTCWNVARAGQQKARYTANPQPFREKARARGAEKRQNVEYQTSQKDWYYRANDLATLKEAVVTLENESEPLA